MLRQKATAEGCFSASLSETSTGLFLHPGTPLLEEAERGEFTPLDERELMQELHTFLSLLDRDCELNTHHTSSLHLSGPFIPRKQQILDALQEAIDHADIEAMTRRRQQKRGL